LCRIDYKELRNRRLNRRDNIRNGAKLLLQAGAEADSPELNKSDH
jgi:hypothetical protein